MVENAASLGHLNLALGGAEALLHFLIGVAAAIGEPLGQRVGIGRQNEDEQGIGILIADLQRALDVDLKEHVLPGHQIIQRRMFGGTVKAIVHEGVFEKCIGIEPFEEFLV